MINVLTLFYSTMHVVYKYEKKWLQLTLEVDMEEEELYGNG